MKKIIKVILITTLGLTTGHVFAQNESNESNSADVWEAPKLKSYSKKQIKAECKKYNKKYISYYSKVYFVKDCKRHEVKSQIKIERLSLRYKVISVDSPTIIMIKKGLDFDAKDSNRSCKTFNNKYVMNQNGDVFWVKNCVRRAFPDWETYITDRRRKKLKNSDIIEVTDSEFNNMKVGKPLKSILDAAYEKLYTEDEFVEEIIPVDEACSGINGKFISYYSKIYKVVKCYKKEVDAEKFLVKYKNYKPIEVSSTVWLSLPTGKPYKL